MLLIPSIDAIPVLTQPCGLTIGSFDGVHLGHQALLKRLREKLPADGILVVFTFSNHPAHHFASHTPLPLICPPLQKAKLLAEYGADMVILIPFTADFSQILFDQFLSRLKEKLGFTQLVLGTGATFGRYKEGNEENVKRIAPKLGFEAEYLPKLTLQGAPISSGRIRSLIAQGALHEVQTYLGRPYSLLGHLRPHNQYYSLTATGLCLPPEGVYPVRLNMPLSHHLARAHVSPKTQALHLELLEEGQILSEQEVEIVF